VVFADVGDRLTLVGGEKLELEVVGPTARAAGAGGDNLVLKAARALGERVEGLRLGRFRLDKQLPVAEAGEGYSEGDTCEALVGMHRLALATRDRRGQERAGRSLPPGGGKGRPGPYCFNTPKFTCVLL